MARNISTAGVATTLASAVALLFSAVSLYQTVLRQSDLKLYVSPTAHYTADNSVGAELFAVPITVANVGARAGTVLALELSVKRSSDGETRTYYGAYQVDGDYFIGSAEYDWQTKRMKKRIRPKAPFSPISVAGQSAHSGTVLFYPVQSHAGKLVTEKGDFVLTVTTKTKLDDSTGFDLFEASTPKQVTIDMRLPFYNRYTALQGGTLQLLGKELLPNVEGGNQPNADGEGSGAGTPPPAGNE